MKKGGQGVVLHDCILTAQPRFVIRYLRPFAAQDAALDASNKVRILRNCSFFELPSQADQQPPEGGVALNSAPERGRA